MANNKILDIGSRIEPFFDDWLISNSDGIKLQLHHPIPQEIVLDFDSPWEGPSSSFASVFRDKDLYRMYYRGAADHYETTPEKQTKDVSNVCYAESSDGIHWTRPDLGLCEFEGSFKNNIIMLGRHDLDNGRPIDDFFAFKDHNPKAKKEEQYKAISNVNWKIWGGGIWGFASPDGIHWKRIQDTPLFTDGKEYDGPQGPACWDPHRKIYHAYLRGWAINEGKEVEGPMKHIKDFVEIYLRGENPENYRENQYRSIRHSFSKDFVSWSNPSIVQFENPLSMEEQYYTNSILPYFRAPHILVGFPKRFAPFRHKKLSHPSPGVSDGGLITSRDGVNWKNWKEAFIRPGLDQKNWTDRNIITSFGMIETAVGEISIYWNEHIKQRSCRLRRGTLRTDGFVSAHADYSGGQLITHPFLFEGKNLLVNYSTSAFGSIQVEIQNETGNPIKGFEMERCPAIYGDEIQHAVSWETNQDLSSLSGIPIRLRFSLIDADLYSIQFSEAPNIS